MTQRILLLALAALVLVGTLAPAAAQAGDPAPEETLDEAAYGEHIEKARAAAKKLRALAAEPAPASLDDTARAAWDTQSKALETRAAELDKVAAAMEGARSAKSTSDMMAMNMQFLALQNAMQNESRKVVDSSLAERAGAAADALR